MRKTIAESLMGIMLLFVVFLVARHGGLDTSQTLAKGKHTETGPVVVIDPGHGGNDPGKVGVDKSLEKDINLEISKRLKMYLEKMCIRDRCKHQIHRHYVFFYA